MSNKDKITSLVSLIENLEVQDEIQQGIERFERLYRLKETDCKDTEVLYYTLSELQGKITEFKDKLHDFQKAYKELHELTK